MTILNDPATLQSYDPQRKTHVVVETSELETQCSIYQEKKQETKTAEQDYSPIERESLQSPTKPLGKYENS